MPTFGASHLGRAIWFMGIVLGLASVQWIKILIINLAEPILVPQSAKHTIMLQDNIFNMHAVQYNL